MSHLVITRALKEILLDSKFSVGLPDVWTLEHHEHMAQIKLNMIFVRSCPHVE